MKKHLSLLLMSTVLAAGSALNASDRPRVLVTSDGEIDDECSMVRFLLYVNEWDVDADSAEALVTIANPETPDEASFVVPNEPGRTVHIILEVTDNGTPRLTRYQRIVFTVR